MNGTFLYCIWNKNINFIQNQFSLISKWIVITHENLVGGIIPPTHVILDRPSPLGPGGLAKEAQ